MFYKPRSDVLVTSPRRISHVFFLADNTPALITWCQEHRLPLSNEYYEVINIIFYPPIFFVLNSNPITLSPLSCSHVLSKK